MARIKGVTPEETKERLIDAAARVFELKGFSGATVAQIASEAGMTTGAIYAHYPNKAALLVDAVRIHGDRATSSIFPPGAQLEISEVLIALASRLGGRDSSDSALLAEALLASRRDPELAEVLTAALEDRQLVLKSMIIDGQAQGTLRPELSPNVAARFGMMLGLGSMIVSELDMAPVDQDEWAAFVQRFIKAFIEDGST